MNRLESRLGRLERQARQEPSRPWAKLLLDADDDGAASRIAALHAQGFDVVVRTLIDPPARVP